MYKWKSVTTGELAKDFKDVLRQIWEDLKRFHIPNIIWKYNRDGFGGGLPTFLYASATHINKEWDGLSEDGKRKAINDYLFNEYGCRCDFTYREYEGYNGIKAVHIADIKEELKC